MDDELKLLEAELESLRPAALRPEFLARLDRERASRAHARAAWAWAALPLAAAAALAVANHVRHPQPEAAAALSDSVFRPVRAENVLYDETDQGYLKLADGTVARQVRSSYVDTFTWSNPKTHASLTWSVPRSEVRVVPAVFE